MTDEHRALLIDLRAAEDEVRAARRAIARLHREMARLLDAERERLTKVTA